MSQGKKGVPTIMPRQFLTERQVSEMGVAPMGTLRRWRCAGGGPDFIKMGEGPKARVKYDAVDIHAYVDKHRRYPSVRATLGE